MIAATENLLADQGKRDRLAAAAKTMYDAHFGLQRLVGLLRNEADRGCPLAEPEGIRITRQDAATRQRSS
jgi:hypothetical protein